MPIRDYCARRLPVEDANDALAEIFLVLWRRRNAVPYGDRTRPWIFGVARNVVARQLRSRRRRSHLLARIMATADGTPIPTADDGQLPRDTELDAAFRRLRPVERELVGLKVWEELSHAEIARVLGTSTHAIDMRVHRTMKKLRRLLSSMTTSNRRRMTGRAVEGDKRGQP